MNNYTTIMVTIITALTLFWHLCNAKISIKKNFHLFNPTAKIAQIKLENKWETKYYETMPVDHFSATNMDTFKLK